MMDDLPDASHVADTACSLCGAPLGEDSYVFEDEEGGLMPVCSTCATADPPADEPAEPEEPSPETTDAVQDGLRLFEELIASRDREADDLRSLATLVADLSGQVELWRDRAEGLRERYRTLETELERTVEHLRSTERLLALGSPPANRMEDGSPLQPLPRPQSPTSLPLRPPAPPSRWTRCGPCSATGTRASSSTRSAACAAVWEDLSSASLRWREPNPGSCSPWPGRSSGTSISSCLEEGLPPDERVTAFAEGMEMTELAPAYKVRNASIDDSGRVDASEMEVGLLAEGTELLTDMSAERAAAIDDATEEIWDQHAKPEFRWDD